MFLDVAYFDGELSIPNAKRNNAPGAASILQAVGEYALDWYLEKFEHKCLVEFMGEDMYSRFIQGVEDEDENWISLRDKIFIEKNGFKYSFVANYVYFYAMRDMQTQTSPKGEVRGKQDHASTVSAYPKLVRVWNDMVDLSIPVRKFICDNNSVYGDICGVIWEPINVFGI